MIKDVIIHEIVDKGQGMTQALTNVPPLAIRVWLEYGLI